MRRPRKNPSRPGPNAMSGDGKGRIVNIGHVRARVVNLIDPENRQPYTGPKSPSKPIRVDESRSFLVRHLTPVESARERSSQRAAQRRRGVNNLMERGGR